MNEEFSSFKELSEQNLRLIEDKLDDLIILLGQTSLDNNTIRDLQNKFDSALRASHSTAIQPYSKLTGKNNKMDGDLNQLLFINTLDIKSQRKHTAFSVVRHVIRIIIALLLILLGFGMIIMPAPPYFEMFTLFYLNANDGVTIMDVISLIVAFTGVYLLTSSIIRLRGK